MPKRTKDAWLYTPERLAKHAAARASAQAGRTVTLSREDLRRPQALDDNTLGAEIERLRIQAEAGMPLGTI